jgi:hypothetical protein
MSNNIIEFFISIIDNLIIKEKLINGDYISISNSFHTQYILDYDEMQILRKYYKTNHYLTSFTSYHKDNKLCYDLTIHWD